MMHGQKNMKFWLRMEAGTGCCEQDIELRLSFLTTSVDLSCYGETCSVHFDPIFPVTFL